MDENTNLARLNAEYVQAVLDSCVSRKFESHHHVSIVRSLERLCGFDVLDDAEATLRPRVGLKPLRKADRSKAISADDLNSLYLHLLSEHRRAASEVPQLEADYRKSLVRAKCKVIAHKSTFNLTEDDKTPDEPSMEI